MKLFQCQSCGQVVFFENAHCERCGHTLGYFPKQNVILALEGNDGVFRPLNNNIQTYRFCANAAFGSCNWLIDTEGEGEFCAACRHNRTIPDLSVGQNLAAWRSIETAKHRLFYALLRHKLPLKTRAEDPSHGLAFDFLAGEATPTGPKILTGHDNGLITIA